MEVAGAAKGRRGLMVLAIVVGLGLLGAGGWYGWTLHEELDELRTDLADVHAEMQAKDVELERTLRSAASAVSSLDGRVDDLEYDVGRNFGGSLSDRVDELSEEVDSLRRCVNSLSGDVSSFGYVYIYASC